MTMQNPPPEDPNKRNWLMPANAYGFLVFLVCVVVLLIVLKAINVI